MKIILLLFVVTLIGCKSEVKPTVNSKPQINNPAKKGSETPAPKPQIELEKNKSYSAIRIYDYLNAHELGYLDIGIKEPTLDPIFTSLNTLAQKGLARMSNNLRVTKVNKKDKIWQIHFLGETEFADAQDEKNFMLMIKKTIESYTYDYKVFLNNKPLNLN